MKKKLIYLKNVFFGKTLKIMKISFFLFFVGVFQVFAANNYAQSQKLTLSMENTTIANALQAIEDQSDFKFFYNNQLVDVTQLVTVNAKKDKIWDVLDQVLPEAGITYHVVGKQVALFNDTPGGNKDMMQPITVTGTVTDENGEPLPGLSIMIKGTTDGTVTNLEGEYSIEVEGPSTVLVFSFIGYISQEVIVGEQTVINISIEQDILGLEEVVVIGYGTVKKSDLTGSVSSLNSDDFNPGANVSIDQMMLGRAAGVNISQTSSEPGGGLSIRIRGASSINAGNRPLYVIDGMPIDNSSSLAGTGDGSGNTVNGGVAGIGSNVNPRNPLNSLNASDVESIEILKDASATAIYGSRGANGVILITTKKGKKGGFNVNYDSQLGIQTVAKKMNLLSTAEYIDGINAISEDGGDGIVFSPEDINSIGKGTDWQDNIFRQAILINQNISVSGGTDKTTYFTSFNYFNQEGVIKNSGIKKYIGRVNIQTELGEKVVLGVNVNTSSIWDDNNTDGLNINESGGPIYTSLLYDPTEPILNNDGTYARSSELTINNPVMLVEEVSSKTRTNRTLGNIYLDYNITDELSAKLNVGTDRKNSRRDIYNSQKTLIGGSRGGIGNIVSIENSNILLEYTMNYNKRLNENHSFNILGGATYQKFAYRTSVSTMSGFPSDLVETNNLALGDPITGELSSRREENTLISYIGRANYNLFNKFLFTGSIRVDGSSRFGENNKYGLFPSFAFGWKLSEEAIFQEFFNVLKLRASWGQIGNQEIGNYASLTTFGPGSSTVFNNQEVTSLSPTRIANPDLKWETTEQFNVGLDVSIFKGRLSGTFDYFIKNTKDMLINIPLPVASGYSFILGNLGEMENKGIEVFVSSINVSKRDFSWQTTLNFSSIQNEVKDLGSVGDIVTGALQAVGNTSVIRAGEALASYFGFEVTGIFQEDDDIPGSAQPTARPGDPIFLDVNGDNVINANDKIIIGNALPDFFYGMLNSFTYKNFQLDIFIQGQQGVDLLNINMIESMYPQNFRRNRIAEPILNRWTPQNTDTKWPSSVDPSGYGGGKVNTLVMQDASYIRLKNIKLSYNIPVSNSKFLQSLSVYVAAQNLITITDYEGFDPEANSFGQSVTRVDYSSYPLAKSWIFGLNLVF